MIKIRIRNAGHEVDVRFPVSESKLYAKLSGIHAVENRNDAQSAYVTEVYWPEEFSILKDRFANLDELNYLARRMESFDTLEYDQFLIGITKLDSKEVKDLINLTFNLDHFTLCQDVSSYGKIGRALHGVTGRTLRTANRSSCTRGSLAIKKEKMANPKSFLKKQRSSKESSPCTCQV